MRIPASLPNPGLICEQLLEKAGVSHPPIPLERIVGFWKELSVVEENLDGSGYLLSLGRMGAEIIVNRNEPEDRRRFTIAHELGHWVLGVMAQRETGNSEAPWKVSRQAIEKWCDAFAANLLMPADALRSLLPPREDPALINAILHGPARFRVSKEAFFIRVWEVLGIQVAVLRLGGASRSGFMAVETNHADPRYGKELLKLLAAPAARQQLEIAGEVVSFALRSPAGLTSISGRRIGSRLVLAVAWPRSNPAAAQGFCAAEPNAIPRLPPRSGD